MNTQSFWGIQNFVCIDLVVATQGNLFSKPSIFILCVFLITCYNLQQRIQC